jgi:hypothetical protein
MVNAIVAGSVVLALAALYFLARTPNSRAQSSRPRSKGRVQRLLRIAVRRAAHRHEHWLRPVDWNGASGPFRTPHSPAGAARRRKNLTLHCLHTAAGREHPLPQ